VGVRYRAAKAEGVLVGFGYNSWMTVALAGSGEFTEAMEE